MKTWPAFSSVAEAMVAPATVALIAVGSDLLNRRLPFFVPTTGALDEIGHAGLMALVLWTLQPAFRLPRRFCIAALLSSVLIDLDHLPLYVGLTWVAVEPGGRPVTHSMATVVALAAAALLWRSKSVVLLGLAAGVVVHVVRDLLEGPPGVPLLWPWTDQAVSGAAGGAGFLMLVGGLLLIRLVLIVSSEARVVGAADVANPSSRRQRSSARRGWR